MLCVWLYGIKVNHSVIPPEQTFSLKLLRGTVTLTPPDLQFGIYSCGCTVYEAYVPRTNNFRRYVSGVLTTLSSLHPVLYSSVTPAYYTLSLEPPASNVTRTPPYHAFSLRAPASNVTRTPPV